MFELADVISTFEVGIALLRKVRMLKNDDNKNLDKFKTMSRLFASKTAQIATEKFHRILYGTDKFGADVITNLESEMGFTSAETYAGVIDDFDHLLTYL